MWFSRSLILLAAMLPALPAKSVDMVDVYRLQYRSMSDAIANYNDMMSVGNEERACRELGWGVLSANQVNDNSHPANLVAMKYRFLDVWNSSGCGKATTQAAPKGKAGCISAGGKTVCL